MILYSTECPLCLKLEERLEQKNIPFTLNTDRQLMEELGFQFVPVLELDDGTRMNFREAIKWVSDQEEHR